MATFAEIEAEVKRIVEDRITELDSAIATHVARAQRAIESRCAFNVQRAEITYQVEPLTTNYAKPADYIDMRRKPFFLERSDSQQYTYLEEVDAFDQYGLRTDQGIPKYWRDSDTDGYLQFWPIGDGEGPSGTTAGAYEVVVPYFKSLNSLSAADSTNWWSMNMDDVLAWRAAAFVFAELRDPMANWWSSVAAARFIEIRNQTKRNRMRQSDRLIYPTESLSSRSNARKRWGSRKWIADIP